MSDSVGTTLDEVKALVAQYKTEEADKIAAMSGDAAEAYGLKLIRKAKQAVRIKKHDAAQDFLNKFIETVAGDDPEIKSALAIVKKAIRTASTKKEKVTKGLFGTRTNVATALDGFITIGDTVSEGDIFTKFHFARSDMRKAIIENLKKALPADRKWIDLDVAIESYVLRGIGDTAPEGWTGYVPRAKVGVEVGASDATIDAASMS